MEANDGYSTSSCSLNAAYLVSRKSFRNTWPKKKKVLSSKHALHVYVIYQGGNK